MSARRGWRGRRAGEQFPAGCLTGSVQTSGPALLARVGLRRGGGAWSGLLASLSAAGKVIHALPLAPDPRLWLSKATYDPPKARILGCATFRRHAVKRDFPPRPGKGLVLGREETCRPPRARGPNLFYIEREPGVSPKGAPFWDSWGEPPLPQPSGRLGHQGLAGQFPTRLSGCRWNSRCGPEGTSLGESLVLGT